MALEYENRYVTRQSLTKEVAQAVAQKKVSDFVNLTKQLRIEKFKWIGWVSKSKKMEQLLMI